MSTLLEVDGFRSWCLRCRRPGRVCLCDAISTLQPRSKFVFLTHPKENRKTKNGSGRLAHLALAGSELLVGVDFSRHPRVVELLSDPSLHCRLLYPSPLGRPEAADDQEADRTPVLFVLDGTWPCAKKMVRLSTNLHALPRVSLHIDRPSEFVTKHQPDPSCLATIEAVDRALRALARDGSERYDEADSERLLRPFRTMIDMALAHAADPGRKSYRDSGPFKTQAERVSRRTVPTTGRNVMFQG